MPSINDLFPSRWLKHEDLPDDEDLVMTIKGVTSEEVGQGDDRETKAVIWFRETDKGLVLNKTNATAIAQAHGDDTDDWTGKKIALFVSEVEFRGKMTLAIRVRLRKPKAAAAKEPVGAAAGGKNIWAEDE